MYRALKDKVLLSLHKNYKCNFVKCIPPNANVLDVGCGNDSSFFVKRFSPNCYYVGSDISNYNNSDFFLKYADEYHLFKKSLFNKSIKKLGKFDYIICSHVIEHSESRDDLLQTLFCACKDNGKIYLSFPSIDSMNFPSRRNCLNYYDDPTHVALPPDFDRIIELANKKNYSIEYATKNYKTYSTYLIGLILEPLSKFLNKKLFGTWEYYGFESVIILKKNKELIK